MVTRPLEKFHFDLKNNKPFKLVFPHIPKTGGTTLLYHFRKNFGDNNILSYGPHNRCVRFFANKPQLEELSAQRKSQLRIIQGHGVNDMILPLLPDEKVKLMVVLRNPTGLTRSRYNHHKNGLAKRGIEVTSDSFLRSEKGDIMSQILLKKFNNFFDRSANTRRDRVVSILQKFDYVFTTEQLDAQVGGLMDELALPHELERRRIAEKKSALDATDEQIVDANPLDTEIFETANQVLETKEQHNPFGFDAEGRDRVLSSLNAKTPPEEETLTNMFQDLAKALCKELRAEAGLTKLMSGGPIALSDPGKFRDILTNTWAEYASNLTSERAKISADFKARWLQQN